uniref:Transmembrane protein n=1 Tax=Moniliophthora roreri TaxID=221103 RepID=A0A0W0EX15_MONRR
MGFGETARSVQKGNDVFVSGDGAMFNGIFDGYVSPIVSRRYAELAVIDSPAWLNVSLIDNIGWMPFETILIPRPFSMWSAINKRWLLPLYFVLSAAWALELSVNPTPYQLRPSLTKVDESRVTHLEGGYISFSTQLGVNGPSKRDWFHSWEFRVWSLGSIAAVLGMPIAVLVRRKDYDTCIAWILFSGSSAGTLTTICFIYVLVRFPGFMRRVKSEGAEPDVVVRLATFYQLNVIRIVFRFLFNFSLLTLALDGILQQFKIARTIAAADLLSMLGGIGCFVSSAITLLIFFPRSITRESGYRAKISSTPSADPPDGATSPLPDYYRQSHSRNPSSPKSPDGRRSPRMNAFTGFRFPTQSEHSLPSTTHMNQHRITRPTSYPSNRRYSGERDATPEYESDPESATSPSPLPLPARRQSRKRRGGGEGEMIWEMQRPDEMVRAYRQRHPHQPRSVENMDEHQPPSWSHEDAPFKPDHRMNGKGNISSSAVVVLPTDGPPTLEDGHGFSRPSPRSSFVHPYVMTFTSPIDLLDISDDSLTRAV